MGTLGHRGMGTQGQVWWLYNIWFLDHRCGPRSSEPKTHSQASQTPMFKRTPARIHLPFLGAKSSCRIHMSCCQEKGSIPRKTPGKCVTPIQSWNVFHSDIDCLLIRFNKCQQTIFGSCKHYALVTFLTVSSNFFHGRRSCTRFQCVYISHLLMLMLTKTEWEKMLHLATGLMMNIPAGRYLGTNRASQNVWPSAAPRIQKHIQHSKVQKYLFNKHKYIQEVQVSISPQSSCWRTCDFFERFETIVFSCPSRILHPAAPPHT